MLQQQVYQCKICDEQVAIADEHHVIIQAAGGKHKGTVDLCANCHLAIHAQAVNILAKKAVKKRYFLTAELEKKAAPYVNAIVYAMIRERERPSANARSQLTLMIPKHSLEILHLLKSDAGISNLQDFIKRIIQAYAAKKGIRLDLREPE